MTKKSIINLVLLISMIFISGIGLKVEAETEFFGMEVYNVGQAINAFEVWSNEDGSGVEYNYKKDLANPDIVSFADVSYSSISFQIHNNSNAPIELNYYTDIFELATNESKVYEMEKPDILDYPSDKVLNPDEVATIKCDNPLGTSENIMFISATLGLENIMIFLKKVE